MTDKQKDEWLQFLGNQFNKNFVGGWIEVENQNTESVGGF
jgi:hypothetical protein